MCCVGVVAVWLCVCRGLWVLVVLRWSPCQWCSRQWSCTRRRSAAAQCRLECGGVRGAFVGGTGVDGGAFRVGSSVGRCG